MPKFYNQALTPTRSPKSSCLRKRQADLIFAQTAKRPLKKILSAKKGKPGQFSAAIREKTVQLNLFGGIGILV